jgi:hypothetical protein
LENSNVCVEGRQSIVEKPRIVEEIQQEEGKKEKKKKKEKKTESAENSV